ncbi:MAG: DgaE family pyridoxal phosphate-dependent ammonia lyase [Alphaproteobacteria bacterium]|jgi:L-seryl-tRNA(Ser) seleniumtransferase/D-glucosaminate-6-phosphate ammonia-lyase|nr:DgaE family pyridoxal phosphate-dependent ammonia lyase [Alphaproteobacteria bacterium]
MENIYTKLGLPRVINGSGKMTYLGVSTLSQGVANAFLEASQNYVIVDDLINTLGKRISQFTGGEDTCITASASAGITIAVAGMIAKDNLVLIEQLPHVAGKNQVILPKGHAINYGTSITTMIGLGGGVAIEAGQANMVKKEHIINSINDNTVALMYVKSHHCVQKGILSIAEMVEISKEYNLPLIIDAAAEEDIQKYIKLGASLVIYSGAKALAGPTSGFITGKSELIKFCKAQYKGIGRAMKVSKETATALYQAIVEYQDLDNVAIVKSHKETLNFIKKNLQGLDTISVNVVQDEAGREIYRLEITVKENSPKNALQVVSELKAGNISIHVRDHYANVGYFFIDPRGLINDDKEMIVKKLKEILKK